MGVELYTRITTKTEDTSPDGENDAVYAADVSAGVGKKVTLKNLTKHILSGQMALSFTAVNQSHVNHGCFWEPNVKYYTFFADALIRPTGSGYGPLSAGYGGNHDLLWGVTGDATNGYTITGNIYDADTSTATSFSTVDKLRHNEWAYIAVAYDGASIIAIINGVPSSIIAYTGNRRTNNGYEGTLFVGGSNHLNYSGKIGMVRIMEGNLPYVGSAGLKGTAFRPPVNSGNAASYEGASTSQPFNFVADYRTGSVNDISCGLPNGIQQVITNTVVAGAGITTNGNAKNVVTAAGMPNSPKTVTTAVTTASHTTAALIATAMRTSLRADADVSSFYIVGGSGADITLTAIKPAANDPSANFTIEDDTSAGITEDTTAVQTTLGYLRENILHHGFLAEAYDAGAETNLTSEAGQINKPTLYDRDATRRPVWIVDPFTFPTTVAAQKTQIASTRIYDDFSRADVHYGNSTVLGCGSTRIGTKAWSNNAYGILNGNMYGNSTAPGINTFTDAGVTDKTIIWRRPSSTIPLLVGANYRFVFRYVDASNYEYLYVDEFGTGTIYEVVAGTPTALGANYSFGTTWTEAKVILTGTTVDVYNGGASLGTRTMTVNGAGTTQGVWLVHPALRISEVGVI